MTVRVENPCRQFSAAQSWRPMLAGPAVYFSEFPAAKYFGRLVQSIRQLM